MSEITLLKALEIEKNPLSPHYYVVCTNMMFFDPAIDTTEPEPTPDTTTDEPPDPSAAPEPTAPDVLRGRAMVEHYRATRKLSDLRFKPDCAPTLFKMKRLKPQFTTSLESMNYEEAQLLVVRASCHEVILPTGQSIKAEWSKKPEVHRGHNLCEESWIEELTKRFGISTVLELGPIAFQKARLPEDSKAGFLCQVGLPAEPFEKR